MAGDHGVRKESVPRFLAFLAPSASVVLVVALPFALMLADFLSIASIRGLTGSGALASLTRQALFNSVEQGLLSAAASFAAGAPLGIFMGRYSFKFRRMLRSVTILPFFLPSIVVVSAFITGFGSTSQPGLLPVWGKLFSSGLTGIVAVNTFFNAPLVAMMTMLGVERADRAIDEAAMTLGASAGRRFLTGWGRRALVAASGGALLAFLYSFAGFAAPLIIGGPGYFTLEAWIYFMVRTLNNIPAAAALSLAESLALLLPAMLYLLFLSGTGGRQFALAPAGPAVRKSLPFAAGAAYAVLWVAVEAYILGSVFYASLTFGLPRPSLGNYMQFFGSRAADATGISAAEVIANSLIYGILTTLLVALLGFLWIYGKRRLRITRASVADSLQLLPLIVSAVIFAFSLSAVFEYSANDAYVWVLIVLAQTVVAIPVVLRIIESGFSQIPVSYTEAAFTLGGNAFFEVEMPLARSTLSTALMFGFALSLGEFTATNFLATSRFIPLGVQIYVLQGVRLFGASDAAAAILLIMSTVAFYLIQRGGEIFLDVR